MNEKFDMRLRQALLKLVICDSKYGGLIYTKKPNRKNKSLSYNFESGDSLAKFSLEELNILLIFLRKMNFAVKRVCYDRENLSSEYKELFDLLVDNCKTSVKLEDVVVATGHALAVLRSEIDSRKPKLTGWVNFDSTPLTFAERFGM